MGISFFYRHAGLVSVWLGHWALHILPAKNQQCWGHVEEWYDGPNDLYGLGPVLLLVYVN